MYKPNPIDTRNVKLSSDLAELLELLAENFHDNWAKLRITEGWELGPIRDGVEKKHPCIIPYADLSESEKDYDRKTAIETIKTIIKLGYRIEKI